MRPPLPALCGSARIIATSSHWPCRPRRVPGSPQRPCTQRRTPTSTRTRLRKLQKRLRVLCASRRGGMNGSVRPHIGRARHELYSFLDRFGRLACPSAARPHTVCAVDMTMPRRLTAFAMLPSHFHLANACKPSEHHTQLLDRSGRRTLLIMYSQQVRSTKYTTSTTAATLRKFCAPHEPSEKGLATKYKNRIVCAPGISLPSACLSKDLACIIMICPEYNLSSFYDILSIREGTSHAGNGIKLASWPEVIIGVDVYSVGVVLV